MFGENPTPWIALTAMSVVAFAGLRELRKSKRAAAKSPQNVPAPARAKGVFEKRQEILELLSADTDVLLHSNLEVRHLMSKRVRTTSPTTPVEQVRETMRTAQVRHLLVCDDGRRLLGIISDRDAHQRRGQAALDVMTANPATVSPETPIGQVITLLIDRTISCVPVVDDGAVCGVLTTTDLLLALQCSLRLFEKIASRIEQPGEDGAVVGAMAWAETGPLGTV